MQYIPKYKDTNFGDYFDSPVISGLICGLDEKILISKCFITMHYSPGRNLHLIDVVIFIQTAIFHLRPQLSHRFTFCLSSPNKKDNDPPSYTHHPAFSFLPQWGLLSVFALLPRIISFHIQIKNNHWIITFFYFCNRLTFWCLKVELYV